MESLKHPSVRLKTAALLSAVALTGCSMESEVSPRLSVDVGEPLFPVPAECTVGVDDEPVPPALDGESPKPKTEKDVRALYDDADSPMENRTKPWDKASNAIETMGFFDGEFEKVQEFPLRDSGITVELYSDTAGVHVDEEAFSDILLLPLDKADLFQQSNLRHQMRCYEEAVLEDKEFGGHRVELYIPSNHTLCFTEDFSLEPVDVCEARKEQGLDSRFYRGFTPPQIELETSFFTLKQDSRKQLMFLVGAHAEQEKAGKRADSTLLHEAGHYWWWLNDGPLKMNQGLEQPIEAMEEEVRAILKQKGQPLPRAIHYR